MPAKGTVISESFGNPFDTLHTQKVCNFPLTGSEYVDPFLQMKPKKKDKVKDYEISQSYALIDQDPIKIRYTDTVGTYEMFPPGYVPPPPPKKKVKTHGRGPLTVLLDEMWKKVVDAQQKRARAANKERLKKRKTESSSGGQKMHQIILRTIGPDWFQELSPKQERTVDELAKCIIKDIKSNTITNTQENMASLGLVLRPNHEWVEIAIRECCSSPVEFLLILYQLLNPRRTSYSINDRLLLSSVVHLTIRDTLKELHIRIPSPPREPAKKAVTFKPPKKTKCISPYLEELIKARVAPKPFLRPDKQYAINDYFNYKDKLKANIINLCDNDKLESDNISDEFGILGGICASQQQVVANKTGFKSCKDDKVNFEKFFTDNDALVTYNDDFDLDSPDLDNVTKMELMLVREWQLAQNQYNKMAKKKCVHALQKPSIYIPCCKKLNSKEVASQSSVLAKVNASQNTKRAKKPSKTSKIKMSQVARVSKRNSNQRGKGKNLRKRSGTKKGEKSDECLGDGDREEVSIPSFCSECLCSTSTSSSTSCTSSCSCDNFKSSSRSTSCDCSKSSSDSRLNSDSSSRCAIDCDDSKPSCELAHTDYDLVSQVETMAERAYDPIRDYNVGNLLNVQSKASEGCLCREKIMQRIDDNQCPCANCRYDWESKNIKTTFVIADTKESEDGKPVRIISDVKAETICNCMEKYQLYWDKYEKRKEVKKVQADIKSLDKKFVINGTAVGPDGKLVYIINSAVPKKECQCYRIAEEEGEEKTQMELLPQMPEGCIKYVVSGVHERPEGSVYILSGITPNTECNCMDLYDRFSKDHDTCMKLYEMYLQKIQYDTEEYLKELPQEYSDFQPVATETEKVTEAECKCCMCENDSDDGNYNDEDKNESLSSRFEGSNDSSCHYDCECNISGTESNYSEVGLKSSKKSVKNIKSSLSAAKATKSGLKIKKSKSSKLNLSKSSSHKDIKKKSASNKSIKNKSKTNFNEQSIEFNRYIILDKLPTEDKEQIEILKKALTQLAEDGFPLAKLPDVYRLPHFKLWFQMRCRKYWTREDQERLMSNNRALWKHVDTCRERVIPPKSTFLKGEPEKMNWSYATYIKENNYQIRETFYRRVKWASINYAREFFPTTYSYEFPNKTFRDVFFAYLPSKEEDMFPYNIWKIHDYRDQVRNRKIGTKC